jgi:DNA-binding CsgD family transcriptional regulator
VSTALDGAAESQAAGFDASHGAYQAAVSAEALVRLGRWNDAETVLARYADARLMPVAAMRVGVAAALLAARRGAGDRAATLVGAAVAKAPDPYHAVFAHTGAAEVHVLRGAWTEAIESIVSARAHLGPADATGAVRLAMLEAMASVEVALDARARREQTDEAGLIAQLRARFDTGAIVPGAEVDQARAELTRLTGPDPEAWAEAAPAWSSRDPFFEAMARLREAEAAAAGGEAARAADALRAAHGRAVELGARSVLDEIDAVATRTRLRVEAQPVEVLGADAVHQLGLTPREAEVLALVAAGRTNRQIGEELYVSEKTASVHVSNILRKLDVTSRVEAAAVAQRIGMTSNLRGGPR